MTTTTTAPRTEPRLVCRECRHDNEAERIFCHECGARLDRSGLAKAKQSAEDPQQTRKRLERLLSGRGLKARQTFFLVSKIVLGACALAAVIQMLLAPEVPPSTQELGIGSMSLELENAASDHRVRELRFTEEQVNASLATGLRSKQAALSNFAFRFERALVAFDEGRCRFIVERSAFGHKIYTTGTYAVSLKGGQIVLQNLGGSIGRLRVHPELMKHAGFLFGGVAAALERERKSLAKLGAVEFHPKLVVLHAQQ